MPFPLLRACCFALSVGLWLGVVGPYKLLRRFGVPIGDRWPLATYAKYPFAVLYNDQFDRFSAPVEKRYGRDEVRALLERAGLSNVSVQPCFGWIGEGIRRA